MRQPVIINQLIAAKQTELAADREQLAKLKAQVIAANGAPSEHLQKSINAMRTTIANGAEDLEDLQIELAAVIAYESSDAGQRHRTEAQDKLRVADALIDVCVITAGEADKALNAAWGALRRHHMAHTALNGALSGAYGAVTEGSGFDIHHDQMFLLRSFSDLSNSGAALTEWLVESLKGYDLSNFIEVKGITLNHNDHVTLQRTEGVMLGRCWARMKEIAQRCGYAVHAEDDPGVKALVPAVLNAVMSAKIQ